MIKSRNELIQTSWGRNVYYFLLRNNKEMLDRVLTTRKVNKEEVLRSASKFSNNKEWMAVKEERKYYQQAIRHGWLKEATKHFIPKGNGKRRKVMNLDTKEVYESGSGACTKLGLSKGMIKSAIADGHKAGGYRWAYCDENGNVEEK